MMKKLLICDDNRNIKIQGVDLILTDPPYGITNMTWDTKPVDVVDIFWDSLKSDGWLITTADIKYSSFLLSKHMSKFSHDIVWHKTVGSGQLNINHQPLRLHEMILVFKKGKPVYNRLKTQGAPYSMTRKTSQYSTLYGTQEDVIVENTGERDMTSIIHCSNPRIKNGHPTQKPLKLFQQLADMYSKESDIVFDPYAGSGTTLGITRNVIAIEQQESYYELARTLYTNRNLEIEHQRTHEFQEFVSFDENRPYTVFSSKA